MQYSVGKGKPQQYYILLLPEFRLQRYKKNKTN